MHFSQVKKKRVELQVRSFNFGKLAGAAVHVASFTAEHDGTMMCGVVVVVVAMWAALVDAAKNPNVVFIVIDVRCKPTA